MLKWLEAEALELGGRFTTLELDFVFSISLLSFSTSSGR